MTFFSNVWVTTRRWYSMISVWEELPRNLEVQNTNIRRTAVEFDIFVIVSRKGRTVISKKSAVSVF